MRIERDLDRFRVPGPPRADLLVAGGPLVAAGVAGHRFRHALHVLEHRLNAPKAAAGDQGDANRAAERAGDRPDAEHGSLLFLVVARERPTRPVCISLDAAIGRIVTGATK